MTSDTEDLDARMKAAGMYTIAEMMGVTPLTRWTVQAGMTNLDVFQAWLERRLREMLRMKAGYELGDKDKGDELFEWVLGHSGAFSEALENFRAAVAWDDWRPIETAPKDGTLFLAWAEPGQHGLPGMHSLCAWDEDAGFCICELRQPTHWKPLRAPPHQLR